MSMYDDLTYVFTTVPGNNAFVVPWDSTRVADMQAASLAAGSVYLAPGKDRGRFVKSVIAWSCETTGQNVTVDEQVLTGVAGTSADWVTQGSGTVTITAAAAPTQREFTPGNADSRLLVSAGATGPTTIILRIMMFRTIDRGA